jgi:Zn-dependent protease with chaperone function
VNHESNEQELETFRMVMKRPMVGYVVFAGLLALCATVANAQQRTLYKLNPNDPTDNKAFIGLGRAVRAVQLDADQLRLAGTDEFNAFYYGQGLFVAGRPLLHLPQWAVDAVMAHEVGHFVYRHVETQTALDQGIVDGLAAFGALLDRHRPQEGTRAGAIVGQAISSLLIPKFTQSQELQADAYAVRVLRAEGYKEPGHYVANALALVERAVGPNSGGFFDTHPSFEERITRLRRVAATPSGGMMSAAATAQRITVGSSAADVVRAQGQPDKRTSAHTGDMFFYGDAWIMFGPDDKVVSWYDPHKTLKVAGRK